MGLRSWFQENVVEPTTSFVEETIVEPVRTTVVEPVVEVITNFGETVSETYETVVDTFSDVASTVGEYASETADAFGASPVDGLLHLTPAYAIARACGADISETPLADFFNDAPNLVADIIDEGPLGPIKNIIDWIANHWKTLVFTGAGVLVLILLFKFKGVLKLGKVLTA